MAIREGRQKLKKRWLCVILAAVILIIGTGFFIYAEHYYRADEAAHRALRSEGAVKVTQTDYGWFFDGPSETEAFIFYPGGKVEETAYAPLLHRLAGQGMDACLVKMPFRLAVLGIDKAEQVMKQYQYDHWYIGGHSLGGAMAADYAAKHGPELDGVFLLAAYPTKPLDDHMKAVLIYGTEDGVLNMKKLEETNRYLPDNSMTYRLEGGNHAQFGNYGKQNGDGAASVSGEEQQQRTVDIILHNK